MPNSKSGIVYKITVQPRAEADIEQAFTYIALRAPDSARRWYHRVRSEISSLAIMPTRCPSAPEASMLGIEIRQIQYGKRPGVYRIVFRIDEDKQEVYVLAVRHGARKPLSEIDLQPFLEL